MFYNSDDIRRQFDSATFGRGADYFSRHKVLDVDLVDGVVKGEVAGSYDSSYQQSIKSTMRGQQIGFNGSCSCPMQSNCKHVVAVLLAALEKGLITSQQPGDDTLPYEVSSWLSQLDFQSVMAVREQASKKPAPSAAHRLIYVLTPQPGNSQLRLQLCKGRIAADGAIRTAAPIGDLYSFRQKPPAYVHPEDHHDVVLFAGLTSTMYGTAAWEPAGQTAAGFLPKLGERGVLYLGPGGLRAPVRRLSPGEARAGQLAWCADEDDSLLRLSWTFDDGHAIDHVLATVPPLYVQGDFIGELILPESMAMLPISQWLAVVARSPKLQPRHAVAFAVELQETNLNGALPMPRLEKRVRNGVRPKPVLTLGAIPRQPGSDGLHHGDFGILSFVYEGHHVEADGNVDLTVVGDGGFDTIPRHQEDEAAAWAALRGVGLHEPQGTRLLQKPQYGELHMASESAWVDFVRDALPELKAQGWQIEATPDFRYDLAEIEDWYAQVAEDDAGSAWLELELGIVVNGAPVPLLPVLVQLIREAPRDFERASLDARGDDEPLLATLPNGTRVALAWGRVKPILRTLGELYFTERLGDALRLPALDVARLAELEAGVKLRWMGGERLRALGRQLAAFERVRPVAAPSGLQASLRPYQAEGLAWMQFLREYGLAGILADDMGLGKTIQTLSHLLVEKEAGRLTEPALVVAPTSLMSNWQAEAARFAPELRVLELTGPDRLQRFGDIAQSDLVLTSYALLPRDEEALRQHRFHLLILDESQYIKNSRSKAAQTAGLLQARHRLCLTGTPLQNHLGELWSQFHFLMPGLLGDEKTFNTDFRKPIEKQGDSERNAFLIRRIKPFLLRRTKDLVAKELPPKTEMVREVDLSGAQRDLYETVRLAMDRKVREEIARKGVARSQIVILDALLKLRQVCCDPRLLKAAGAGKSTAPSAKLQVLMELVDELLAEGRKLLVFSQFTSMLALIEAELQARAVRYALLTGDTVDRAAQVDAFQGGAVPVFLISLKAGGVGLNLTAADTVIHYDPWWNPAAESQATDRAWRIGQDKPVFVYRLIAKGTLEEKIQELQRTKAGLADAVLAGGETQGLQITAEDLLGVLSAK